MKTIGLIGGMSWESTVEYYRIVNTVVKNELGGLHSAKCVLYSVDFHEIEGYQSAGEWAKAAAAVSDAARRLEAAGVDFIVLCTNTMHKVAGEIERAVSIPLLHIADATARELNALGIKKAGLLGTTYTMEQDFYKARLLSHGIETITPGESDRRFVNGTIFNDLCLGVMREEAKAKFLSIIDGLAAAGAQGVILGCTEIGLSVRQEDTPIRLFDTTLIHAEKAALVSMGRG